MLLLTFSRHVPLKEGQVTYKQRDLVRRLPVLTPEWAGLPPWEPGPGHSSWVSQAAPLPEPCLLTFPSLHPFQV